jgi:hypothetical protein
LRRFQFPLQPAARSIGFQGIGAVAFKAMEGAQPVASRRTGKNHQRPAMWTRLGLVEVSHGRIVNRTACLSISIIQTAVFVAEVWLRAEAAPQLARLGLNRATNKDTLTHWNIEELGGGDGRT